MKQVALVSTAVLAKADYRWTTTEYNPDPMTLRYSANGREHKSTVCPAQKLRSAAPRSPSNVAAPERAEDISRMPAHFEHGPKAQSATSTLLLFGIVLAKICCLPHC